jgi:hypothetical protein
VLKQLDEELHSSIAAAATKLNSSKKVRQLSRLAVAAAMQALSQVLETQEAALVLPALCDAARAAVVAAVTLFVETIDRAEQLAGHLTTLLRAVGHAEAAENAVELTQQAHTIISACIKEGSRSPGAAPGGEAPGATAAEAAAALPAVPEALAAALSESDFAAALKRIPYKAQVRVKYWSAGSINFPASMVCGLCIAAIRCLSILAACVPHHAKQ